MSLKVLTESDVTPENTCVFCKKNTVNELKFGPLYYRDGVTTHYFCMLFSAALNQSGSDDQGILGFLPPDIAKEVRRSSRLKCFHCEEIGASIGCCNKRCRKAFHFPCGLQNGTNYQFFGNFESYCADHKMHQKINMKKSDWVCPVCMTSVSSRERPIQASCCKAAVFHKDCMQKVALNAGYFFKCPTCNASKNFTQEMRSLGIYVPQQDASWEREPNAYEDLLYQYSKCDAETCECEEGREHVTEKAAWSLARCRICGASGMHKKCGNLRTIENWACAACVEIEKKADLEKKRIKQENAEKQRLLAASSRIEEKTEDSDDDDFNMADIKISERCYQYFPYDKEDLNKYGNKSLPDWRNLQLTVNLTNWIKYVTIIPEVCSSNPKNDDNDKKKRGRKSKAIPVDNADIIKGKSSNDEALLMAVREEADKIIETIKGKAEKLKELDAVIEKDSVSFDVNKNLDGAVMEQSYEDGSTTKPKCSIFPFVSNFLKSGAFVRDKRKLEMSEQIESVPSKKPLLCLSDDSGDIEDEKMDCDEATQSEDGNSECDKLNVPYNPPSAEKQVVLWNKNGLQHASPKTLKFSKELEDLFNKLPSPQSLILSFSSSHMIGLTNQCCLPALTYNDNQSLSGSQSHKNFDLRLPSSRQPSPAPEESTLGRIHNSLSLATLSPLATSHSGQNQCLEDDVAASLPNQLILRKLIAETADLPSIIEEREDLGKCEIN